MEHGDPLMHVKLLLFAQTIAKGSCESHSSRIDRKKLSKEYAIEIMYIERCVHSTYA